jgi:alpha-L-arabinofuranosidase
MMDFCDAVGIEPVFTTNAVGPETPQDMADLVEYLYGDETTTWGKLRCVPPAFLYDSMV